jgi:hypothetical protein
MVGWVGGRAGEVSRREVEAFRREVEGVGVLLVTVAGEGGSMRSVGTRDARDVS